MDKRSTVAVSVVSNNALAREGLKRILEDGNFTIVDSHSSIEDISSGGSAQRSPDIVILDIGDHKKASDEVEAYRCAMPETKIVVLSNEFCFDVMLEAFKAGVDAFIVKRIDCASLIGSLQLVHLGEKVMPSELISGFPTRWTGGGIPSMPEREAISLLSEREIETLRFLILGSPNKVIAGHLDISEATVKVHVKAILRKLGAQNRTQAAIWAVNNGIELNQTELLVANEGNSKQSNVWAKNATAN